MVIRVAPQTQWWPSPFGSDDQLGMLNQRDVVRALEAGDDGLEFIAVGSDRPEGGDGVQVPVEWPD